MISLSPTVVFLLCPFCFSPNLALHLLCYASQHPSSIIRLRTRCQERELLGVDVVQLGNFPRVPEVVIVNISYSLGLWGVGMVLEM